MYAHNDQQKTVYFTFFKRRTYIYTHDSFNKIIGAAFITKLTPLYSEMFASMIIVQFNKKGKL